MPQSVEETIRIEAPRENVWKVLADIGGISQWAAPVAASEVEGEPGQGAVRRCTFAEGDAISEKFVAWEENVLQRYEITGDMPTASLVSEWELETDEESTLVAYRAEFEPTDEAPAEAVAEELGGTGAFLLEALKTYVETGKVLEPPEE